MAEPTMQRCSRRHRHWSVKQAKQSDCGPSCISIVLHSIGHPQAKTPISEIRELSSKYDGHYRPNVQDARIGSAMNDQSPVGMLAQAVLAVAGSGRDGTMSGNLHQILLNDFNLTNSIHQKAADGAALKEIIRRNVTPTILHVVWSNGSGHFIVADGRETHWIGFSHYCFSDPFYGLVSHKINDTDRTQYRPKRSVTGTFSGWHISNIS